MAEVWLLEDRRPIGKYSSRKAAIEEVRRRSKLNEHKSLLTDNNRPCKSVEIIVSYGWKVNINKLESGAVDLLKEGCNIETTTYCIIRKAIPNIITYPGFPR